MIICLTNFVNIRKHQETTFCKHETKHLIIHLMTFWHFPHCDAVQDFKELVAAAKEAGIKLLMETQRHQKRSPGDLMGELRFDGKTVETNRTESVTHLKVYDRWWLWRLQPLKIHRNTSCVNALEWNLVVARTHWRPKLFEFLRVNSGSVAPRILFPTIAPTSLAPSHKRLELTYIGMLLRSCMGELQLQPELEISWLGELGTLCKVQMVYGIQIFQDEPEARLVHLAPRH